MSEHRRYDSAMFWLAFGTAASVIGLALMTIGVSRSASGANLLTSPWFDIGLALLALGGLLLLWALVLYMMHRRAGAQAPTTDGPTASEPSMEVEAVRGYYAERDKLLKMWDREQRQRRGKNKK